MHGRKTHPISCILFDEDEDDALCIGGFGLVDQFGVCIYCLLLYPNFTLAQSSLNPVLLLE